MHPLQIGADIEHKATPTLSTFTEKHPELKCIDGASSYGFNFIVSDDGSAWFAGQMSESLTSSDGFMPLKGLNGHYVVAVSAGSNHALFRAQNGVLFGVGSNNKGQLGLGNDAENMTSGPTIIPYFKDNCIRIQSVKCGGDHNLALSDDGIVYGWGLNDDGQCGVANGMKEGNVETPKAVDITQDVCVLRIECGKYHSGLITVDHMVYLWGWNDKNECLLKESNTTKKVWTPQCVNPNVIAQTKKKRIIDFFLAWNTTMFLLE